MEKGERENEKTKPKHFKLNFEEKEVDSYLFFQMV